MSGLIRAWAYLPYSFYKTNKTISKQKWKQILFYNKICRTSYFFLSVSYFKFLQHQILFNLGHRRSSLQSMIISAMLSRLCFFIYSKFSLFETEFVHEWMYPSLAPPYIQNRPIIRKKTPILFTFIQFSNCSRRNHTTLFGKLPWNNVEENIEEGGKQWKVVHSVGVVVSQINRHFIQTLKQKRNKNNNGKLVFNRKYWRTLEVSKGLVVGWQRTRTQLRTQPKRIASQTLANMSEKLLFVDIENDVGWIYYSGYSI